MKIWAFFAEIFTKQYWCFLIIDFQCNFDISAIMHLRSLQRWIITEWLWNFFKTRSQNGPISGQWKHQSELIFCILRLSHKHITFDILKKHPVVVFMAFNLRLQPSYIFLQSLPSKLYNRTTIIKHLYVSFYVVFYLVINLYFTKTRIAYLWIIHHGSGQ